MELHARKTRIAQAVIANGIPLKKPPSAGQERMELLVFGVAQTVRAVFVILLMKAHPAQTERMAPTVTRPTNASQGGAMGALVGPHNGPHTSIIPIRGA